MTDASTSSAVPETVPATVPAARPDRAREPVVLWSKPEEEREGTPLLVLFHGYMADEADLMGLADHLPAEFTVASVRAPDVAGPGFSWFPLTRDASYSVEHVVTAVSAVSDWLDTVRSAHSSVSLLGFSQGMGVASSLLRHRPADFTCVVGLSGFAVDAEGHPFFRGADVDAARVPFLWGRDQEDPVISPAMIETSHAWLVRHTNLTKVLYANMFHGINQRELAHVREFLALEVLGVQPTPSAGRSS